MMDFIDLKQQQKLIRKNVDKRISKVLDHGQYIQGPEIKELENKLNLAQEKEEHRKMCESIQMITY